ncbi:MAG: hypothetical protein AAF266_03165 [Planctomycetota bacterium]
MLSDPADFENDLFAKVASGVAATLLLLTGCRPADQIRTYRVAKPKAEASEASTQRVSTPVASAKPQGEPTDRMIGAILRSPSQAWFFKAVGPREPLDEAADTIRGFLESVRIEGDRPEWSVPEGWTEKPGGGMRLATLTIPHADGAGETELSVIGLGLADDWDTQVLDNVNRWRRQLQQPPVTAATLDTAIEPLGEESNGAVLIDQVGWFEGGSMAPFAGAAPRTPPVAPTRPAANELKDKKPAAWTEGPASSMRKASYEAPGDVAITAFAFNAAGAMSDRVANVNRWRGEVGLDPTDAEQLAEETEEITLLGEEGAYFELVGKTETTYAAMTERDGQVWFFKLRGPGEAAEAQRDAFREWLESLSL